MRSRIVILGLVAVFLFYVSGVGVASASSSEDGSYESGLKTAEVPVERKGDEDVLDLLVRQVLERNPALEKLEKNALAAGELVEPAGTLPDPVVGISLSNAPVDDFNLSREPMTSKDFFVTQKIPFPGKLSLKEEIARIRSEAARFTVEEMKYFLAFKTREAYYKLVRVRRDLRITKKMKALFEEYAEVARKLYAVGKAKQQDVFRAQTEVFNLNRRIERLREVERDVVALINTLRSYPVDSEIGGDDFPEPGEVPESLESLVETAKSQNPWYLERLSRIEAGEKAVDLARRELYPDFTLQVRYRQREGRSDYLTGAVSLNVPIFAGRNQGRLLRHSELKLLSERKELDRYLDELRYQIKSSILTARRSREELFILKEAVLPEARRTLEAALSSYSVGELEFNTLVRAALELFRYELEEVELEARYHISMAKIKMLTGEN